MFNTEKELVDVLKNALSCDLRVSYLFSVPKAENVVLTEVDLGYGIADLVVAGYKTVTQYNDFKKLDSLSMSMLFYLEEKKDASYYEIISSMRIQKSRLNTVINKLESCGYVRTDNKSLHLVKKYNNQIEYSCAIEAKLKDWKRALHQAYRYKWFSERAFVCLPSKTSGAAVKNIQRFVELGVGLMTIEPDGMIAITYDPGETPPVSPIMNGLLNELATEKLLSHTS